MLENKKRQLAWLIKSKVWISPVSFFPPWAFCNCVDLAKRVVFLLSSSAETKNERKVLKLKEQKVKRSINQWSYYT